MYSETCNKCSKRVQSFSPFMKCSNCSATYHITCVHLVKDDPVNGDIWYCPPCIQCILPFNHVDDDDTFIEAVIEASMDCSYRIHEINTKIFVPFEINDDSPFHEIDPDMQFYSDNHYIQSTSCDYYLEDSFNEKFGNKGNLDDSLTFFSSKYKKSTQTPKWIRIVSGLLELQLFVHWPYWNLVRWIQGSSSWYC